MGYLDKLNVKLNGNIQKQYNSPGSADKRWNEMVGVRSGVVSKCEQYATWTLPHVLRRDQLHSSTEEVQHDFQSIGARSVNHLSNKLAFSLFNPARPFFRLEAERAYKNTLIEQGLKETLIDASFVKIETAAMRRFTTWRSRTAAIFALKSLIITGNSLLYFPEDGKAQVFNLRDFCILRDLSGKALEIMTLDRKKVATLPPAARLAVMNNPNKPRKDTDDANLYTRIIWLPDTQKYHVFQAVDEFPLVNVNGTYLQNELPWIPLTWDLARGADYGSGLVEEYAGDFHALSTLSQAMVMGAAIAADIKFLVDPAGNTDYKALNDSVTGSYVPGKAEDITIFSTEKQKDWKFVEGIINAYEKRIGMAFLLGSAVTRNAERVTAEEIRFQAQELETGLGGQYSRLAEEFQLPMAYILLKDVDFSIEGKKVEPIIITGLESLSRNSEVEKLILFFQDLALVAQLPDEIRARLKPDEVISIFGSARSVDYDKFMKTEAEYKKDQQEEHERALAVQQAAGRNDAENAALQSNLTKE